MLIDGIALGNYRSFGSEVQFIGPFEKVNIIIGQNNVGKSNIILFIKEHYRILLRKTSIHNRENIINNKDMIRLSTIDKNLKLSDKPLIFGFGYNISENNINNYIDRFGDNIHNDINIKSLFIDILKSEAFYYNKDVIWSLNTVDNQTITSLSRINSIIQNDQFTKRRNDWYKLWSVLTKQRDGDLTRHWIPQSITSMTPMKDENITIIFIPAIRRVTKTNESKYDYSGLGVIDVLAKYQNPSIEQHSYRDDFKKINEFLQELTGNYNALLEVPYERDEINVHMDDKILPLSSLGTGIQEVIILAIAATTIQNSVLCIEEPEIHLHPVLQRKLIHYLFTKTNNQYFITTHSAHIVDAEKAAIFHVRLVDGCSVVESVKTTPALAEICYDLGYRASDILQSNCIIWVEGPSDRIYLNYWIQALDASLIEGLHYSIMFYGGRLLSHLSGNDPEVTEFISLRRMNRYISIMIDSDKRNKQNPINETKKRIQTEFDNGPGFAWVTQGREIENYVADDVYEESLKAIYPKCVSIPNIGQYDDRLQFIDATGKTITKIDKVRLAQQVASRPPNLDVLDLKKQMKKLLEFIKKANDL